MEKHHIFDQDQIQDPPDIQPEDQVFISEKEIAQSPPSQESSYYIEEESEDADSDVNPFQVSSALPRVRATDDERLCEKRPLAFKHRKKKWRDNPKETPLHTASDPNLQTLVPSFMRSIAARSWSKIAQQFANWDEQPRSSAVPQTNEWGAKFLAITLVITVLTVVSGFLWLTIFAPSYQYTFFTCNCLF